MKLIANGSPYFVLHAGFCYRDKFKGVLQRRETGSPCAPRVPEQFRASPASESRILVFGGGVGETLGAFP